MLPPSPAITQGLVRPNIVQEQEVQEKQERMETSEQKSTAGMSPEIEQDSDFVVVPNSLAGDSSKNKNSHYSGSG